MRVLLRVHGSVYSKVSAAILGLIEHIGTVITHRVYGVCYFRDVHLFVNFIIAMYVHRLGLYCMLLRGFLISII